MSEHPRTLNELKSALAELFSERDRWTRYTNARDEHGNGVLVTDPRAVSWCAAGGCSHLGAPERLIEELDDAVRRATGVGIIYLNDEGGYDAMMRYLRAES